MRKPIIKEYKDFTIEERDKSQKLWTKHLDNYCPTVALSCRPCDLGCPCDSCSYDREMLIPYTKDCVAHGVPITPDYLVWIEEE